MFKYIDFFTPNETEAEFYYGKKIQNHNEAKLAGEFFIKKGVKNSIITLGDKGVYFSNNETNFPVPALDLKGKVPKLSEDKFIEFANDAKNNCPISGALNCKVSVKANLN